MFFLDPSGNALEFKAFADDAHGVRRSERDLRRHRGRRRAAQGPRDRDAADREPGAERAAGRRVLIKPETLQRVGAFKFRGAYNRLVQLERGRAQARRRRLLLRQPCPGRRPGGAAAGDAGADRHAVATRPAVKVEATRGYGAEVRFYDRLTESREAIVHAANGAHRAGIQPLPAYSARAQT